MKKILITGSTGFVGSALIAKLTQLKSDYKIYKLVRSTPKDQSEIFCDYINKKIDL
jgi:nucleoside-diphosphate-sugar epimerase